MATYPWAANHQRQGVSFEDKPNLKRWHDAIAARPAVARATHKVEAMPTSSTPGTCVIPTACASKWYPGDNG